MPHTPGKPRAVTVIDENIRQVAAQVSSFSFTLLSCLVLSYIVFSSLGLHSHPLSAPLPYRVFSSILLFDLLFLYLRFPSSSSQLAYIQERVNLVEEASLFNKSMALSHLTDRFNEPLVTRTRDGRTFIETPPPTTSKSNNNLYGKSKLLSSLRCYHLLHFKYNNIAPFY